LRSAGDGIGDVVQEIGYGIAAGGGAGELLDQILADAGGVELGDWLVCECLRYI
jgi:hypothetical protein